MTQVKEDAPYFLDKATKGVYQNPERNVEFVQGLLVNDKNNEWIYEGILSESFAIQGNYQKSAQSVLSKEIGDNYSEDFHRFYWDYYLAVQYHHLGFYHQSEKMIQKLISSKSNDINRRSTHLANLFQLQAINYLVIHHLEKAEVALKKSNAQLDKMQEKDEVLRIENQLYWGEILLQKERLDEAEKIFDNLLKNKEIANYPYLKAKAIKNKAQLLFLQQRPEESVELLKQALDMIDDLGYLPLETQIYEELSSAYIAENNNTEYQYYQKLFEKNSENLNENKKRAINYLVGNVERLSEQEQQFYRNQKKQTATTVICVFLGVIMIFALGYFWAFRKEKDLEKQEDFFRIYQKKVVEQKESEKKDLSKITTSISTEKKTLLSPEKEEELLAKLNQFEETEIFLSSQMSLPFLASELETNIKYLSEIIKKHKHKKFNAYINHLRIRYIINVLKTNPVYLNYKVSYLAKVTGYSSHSAFTAVFKSITGMSPNDFIQQISDQNLKKQ